MVRATRSGSSIIGSCPTPGRIVNDAWGIRSRAILSHAGIEAARVVLQPCDGDPAWQGIQRCDLVIGPNKFVDVDGGADDLVKQLKALRRSSSVSVASGCRASRVDAPSPTSAPTRQRDPRDGRKRPIAKIFRACWLTWDCALSPAYQKPAGANAHTVAARPRRANSMAIQPPTERPARCGRPRACSSK